MRNGRPKTAVLILLLALFVLTGPPGTPAENTGSSTSAAAAVANTTPANAAITTSTSPTSNSTTQTAGNGTTPVGGTTAPAANTILRNLTVGYLTALKGNLANRQGLAISGALTLALKEVSVLIRVLKYPSWEGIKIPYTGEEGKRRGDDIKKKIIKKGGSISGDHKKEFFLAPTPSRIRAPYLSTINLEQQRCLARRFTLK